MQNLGFQKSSFLLGISLVPGSRTSDISVAIYGMSYYTREADFINLRYPGLTLPKFHYPAYNRAE